MYCSLDFADSQVMKEKKSSHAQHSSLRFETSKAQSVLCQKYKIKTIKKCKIHIDNTFAVFYTLKNSL